MAAIAQVTWDDGKAGGILVGFIQKISSGDYNVMQGTVASDTYGVVVVNRRFVEVKLDQLTFNDWRD